MNGETDDLARLIHETLEQLGWNADAKEVAERVRRLNIGLPIEDEFIVLCTWLGQCQLIHKLDQVQMPDISHNQFQVPDLLATFVFDKKVITVLIEVKSSKENVLSLRPDYVDRLKAYAHLLGLPILVAWKWHDIWCLFDIERCVRVNKNYNINWETAIKENLLGLLSGDFSYSLRLGCGIHFRQRKIKMLSQSQSDEGLVEEWQTVIDDVYFTDGTSKRINELDPDIQMILMIADLEVRDEIDNEYITKHFTVTEELGLFAHMALVRLLQFRSAGDQPLNWRQHLKNSKVLSDISEFRTAVEKAMKQGFVPLILNPRPASKPDFLNKA